MGGQRPSTKGHVLSASFPSTRSENHVEALLSNVLIAHRIRRRKRPDGRVEIKIADGRHLLNFDRVIMARIWIRFHYAHRVLDAEPPPPQAPRISDSTCMPSVCSLTYIVIHASYPQAPPPILHLRCSRRPSPINEINVRDAGPQL